MQKYIGKLVFEIVNESRFKQFDEQLRWIEAEDFAAAFDAALQLGRLEEDEWIEHSPQKVRWKFVALTHLLDSADFKNGQEILSCIREETENESYKKTLLWMQENLKIKTETPV